jgi:WD40 repeat protein
LTRSSTRLTLFALVLAGALVGSVRPAAGQASPQWYGEGFGKNKIQYREFKWEIYRSPHFNVHYYKEEEPSLQKVVSFAESAYDQLSREFNYQIKDPVPLIFYATHSAFEQNNVILGFIPEALGAFASPARFRMVLPIDLADPELMQLVLHELTHIFQYHMLFQGSLAKAIASSPPQWFMEGMASYMAKDENARDKMYLRDAVVNDRVPSVSKSEVSGFLAYRFGHAVFDFIEERWGKDGFLDFLYEMRNTIGSRPERAIQRAFKMEPEDFDLEFRRWLRKKYLAQLLETGEPSDFGRLFRNENVPDAPEISPTASPSGDLVAALSAYTGDLDVVLFNAQKRTLIRNLTKGFSDQYQYLVSQELILGRDAGRDLAFSPDGNTIAVFAKRERGRSLVLLDALNGGIRRIIDMNEIEQQLAPAWSLDGKKIAFSGNKDNHFDIFVLDLDSTTITNFTNDDIYDGAPAFSPDGKSLIYISNVGNAAKIFRSDLSNPSQRYQLTTGETSENDPIYAPDGKRIYFTSDRDGRDNIYSLDLATGDVRQYTNVVTGAFMPTVLHEPDGKERIVFTGYWKSNFHLYVTDVDQPLKTLEKMPVPTAPTEAKQLAPFEPDIQVTVDPANKDKFGGFKFFLENAQSYLGVDNQDYVGRILLQFSDYLGNRRILADLSAVESLSNFNFTYLDLTHRHQWQVQLFDEKAFYTVEDFARGELRRGRTAYEQAGVIGSLVYPLSFQNRAEIGLGYLYRRFNAQVFITNPDGSITPELKPISDNFPLLTGALITDTTRSADYGAVSGHRGRLDVYYAPDLKESGAVFESAGIDYRQYIPVTQRSNLALRGFAGANNGNQPSPLYLGGLDTIRAVNYRDLAGDRGFFANAEYRFPLLDLLATPIFAFQGIRGVVFFDVGGAWYNDFQSFDFYDSKTKRLKDAIADYGWGLTVSFTGVDLNWDFARQYDLKQGGDFRTIFWIGTRF